MGPETDALAIAAQLGDALRCTILAPAPHAPDAAEVDGVTVLRGGTPVLVGSLGDFVLGLSWPQKDGETHAGPALRDARFDLVLDLCDPPHLSHELPPLGYYAPRGDPAALRNAIETLPEMRGEFEKPKFFGYTADLCAHGRSGIPGCTRCLDVCPTLAITSLGDQVSVDPKLCQGGGACAAVCPTGAISYAFPTLADLLGHVRSLLASYREAGGKDPSVLFFDAQSAADVYGTLADSIAESVLPVEVEEVGSVGMNAWLSCLAYGARAVVTLTGPATPPRIRQALLAQHAFAQPILEGMGYAASMLRVLAAADTDEIAAATEPLPANDAQRPALFAPPDDKRALLRLAVNHLYRQAPSARQVVALPEGAPFGQVTVDQNACTLCMGCVSVCPTAALRDGQGLPQLKFVEWECVQCGLCEKACPEDAITLQPRFLYDDERRGAAQTLHEDQPFLCVVCAKPFATRGVLEVMARKLESHWMFQTHEARRRLKMCDTCRVKDMMRSGAGPDGAPGPH